MTGTQNEKIRKERTQRWREQTTETTAFRRADKTTRLTGPERTRTADDYRWVVRRRGGVGETR